MDTLAFLSAPERSTGIWLSLGLMFLIILGIYIFFSSGKTAFVGCHREIALISLCSSMARSRDIIPAIADSASLEFFL
jgi:hypothetical protein